MADPTNQQEGPSHQPHSTQSSSSTPGKTSFGAWNPTLPSWTPQHSTTSGPSSHPAFPNRPTPLSSAPCNTPSEPPRPSPPIYQPGEGILSSTPEPSKGSSDTSKPPQGPANLHTPSTQGIEREEDEEEDANPETGAPTQTHSRKGRKPKKSKHAKGKTGAEVDYDPRE